MQRILKVASWWELVAFLLVFHGACFSVTWFGLGFYKYGQLAQMIMCALGYWPVMVGVYLGWREKDFLCRYEAMEDLRSLPGTETLARHAILGSRIIVVFPIAVMDFLITPLYIDVARAVPNEAPILGRFFGEYYSTWSRVLEIVVFNHMTGVMVAMAIATAYVRGWLHFGILLLATQVTPFLFPGGLNSVHILLFNGFALLLSAGVCYNHSKFLKQQLSKT